MNKNLTKGRIVRYAVYLALACTLVFGMTYARYSTQVEGTASAKTADVQIDSTIDLTEKLSELNPGTTKKIKFQVTNKKEDKVSEVGQEYTITITTTGNLPLTYTLTPEQNADPGKAADTGVSKDTGAQNGSYVGTASSSVPEGNSYTWTGGMIPYSNTGVIHTYILSVEWPDNDAKKSTADYSNEIDRVTLTVDAKQIEPTKAN